MRPRAMHSLIDVEHPRTYTAAALRALPALGRYGIKRFDRRTLLDERRYITRTLAGVYRADATNERGELQRGGVAVHQPVAARLGVLGTMGAAAAR